jgi:hypothetical protein
VSTCRDNSAPIGDFAVSNIRPRMPETHTVNIATYNRDRVNGYPAAMGARRRDAGSARPDADKLGPVAGRRSDSAI